MDADGDAEVGAKGLNELKHYIQHGRSCDSATSPMVLWSAPRTSSSTSRPSSRSQARCCHVRCRRARPRRHRPRRRLDQLKAVLVDYETGDILYKAYTLSKGNPIQDTKDILAEIQGYMDEQGANFECMGFGATGYAANVLEESVKADVNIVETVAHMQSVVRFVPDADVVCDIGGHQGPLPERGQGRRSRRQGLPPVQPMLRRKRHAAPGHGRPVRRQPVRLRGHRLQRGPLAEVLHGCAVFLDADRVNFQKEGFTAPQMLAGLAKVLPTMPGMAQAKTRRVWRGLRPPGRNPAQLAAVKAQVDYIRDRVPNAKVVVHPHRGEAGAIGAAMETFLQLKRRGHSTLSACSRPLRSNTPH